MMPLCVAVANQVPVKALALIRIACLVLFLGMLSIACRSACAGLILDLKAASYDPATGIWTDASSAGNNAFQSDVTRRPTKLAGQTPSGSPAVSFDGTADFLYLTNGISSGAYTVFAVVQPKRGVVGDTYHGNQFAPATMLGGTDPSFQYRVSTLNSGSTYGQEALRSGQQSLGSGTANLPLASQFISINVSVSGTGGTFRFNGSPDGSLVGSGFSSPTDYVGARNDGLGNFVELYAGEIAELRVYDSVLSLGDRVAVEQQLAQVHGVPEPSTCVMALAGLACGGYSMFRRRKPA